MEVERGSFSDAYFSPIKIPVIEHVPWVHKNLPIPPGMLKEVIKLFRKKVASGVYKPSDSSYHSHWFCIKKKSGTLHIVHDLQPLNAVTIHNSGVPPIPDQVIESMAGHSCYSMLDLYSGYDQCSLNVSSRDLTTIQSPVGAIRLTVVPQGWTSAIAIFHGDVVFILEAKIPNPIMPFLDDAGIKGPATCYELEDGGYKTIPTNSQIHRFVWEHANDVHRILHCFLCTGATISAKKLFLAVPEVTILGHKCNYKGRIPNNSKIAKVQDWPECKNLSDVHAFLGLTGYMRIWIKNYSAIAHPLVNLTCKDTPFAWHPKHEQAMQSLKSAIIQSSALISIDYTTDRAVYLSVDLSVHGVGWILAQDCPDGRHRPSRFGLISWNKCKSHYSQAKVELYGLFRVLHATRLHLIGIRNLIVEVDTSYIKGMLSNPDIQPNAAINRWIVAIQLFDFKLVHVPADKHKGPNGLSRCKPVSGKDEEDDPNDWIDSALSLGTWVVSWLDFLPTNSLRTDALVLSLESNEDNNDSATLLQPCCDCHLPARFRTSDFISTDTSCPTNRLRPLLSDTSRSAPPVHNNNNSITIDNTNFDTNNNNNNFSTISNQHHDTSQPPNIPVTDLAPAQFPASDKASKADGEIERI